MIDMDYYLTVLRKELSNVILYNNDLDHVDLHSIGWHYDDKYNMILSNDNKMIYVGENIDKFSHLLNKMNLDITYLYDNVYVNNNISKFNIYLSKVIKYDVNKRYNISDVNVIFNKYYTFIHYFPFVIVLNYYIDLKGKYIDNFKNNINHYVLYISDYLE